MDKSPHQGKTSWLSRVGDVMLAAKPSRSRLEEGFVLIPIIAVVLVFAMVSGGIAARGRLQILQETNRIRTIQFAARVDGLVRLLAWQLASPGTAGGDLLPVDGRLVRCTTNDSDFAVRITDQDALLDLNGAPLQMLIDVLTAIGVDEDLATQIANEIVDYRSRTDASQPMHGGKDEDYRRAGLSWGPRNDFFVDPQEFVQIPGAAANPGLARKLMPLLTTYNGRPAIDVDLLSAGQPNLLSTDKASAGRLAKWAARSRHTRFYLEVDARSERGRVSFARQAAILIGSDGGPMFLKWARQMISGEAGAAFVQSRSSSGEASSPVCQMVAEAVSAGRP